MTKPIPLPSAARICCQPLRLPDPFLVSREREREKWVTHSSSSSPGGRTRADTNHLKQPSKDLGEGLLSNPLVYLVVAPPTSPCPVQRSLQFLRGLWKLTGWGDSFLMICRNNAGRLGAGLHLCVQNQAGGVKTSSFYVPELYSPRYGGAVLTFTKKRNDSPRPPPLNPLLKTEGLLLQYLFRMNKHPLSRVLSPGVSGW